MAQVGRPRKESMQELGGCMFERAWSEALWTLRCGVEWGDMKETFRVRVGGGNTADQHGEMDGSATMGRIILGPSCCCSPIMFQNA